MSQTVNTSICGNCHHDKSAHHDGVCMGDLSCQCFTFIENELFDLALEVETAKLKLKSVQKRVKFILEKIPPSRNASDKSFAKIYWEFWHGFKIRKGTPSKMDSETWKILPSADNINRMKRLCKQYHEELKTYDPEMIRKQNVMYQAVLEVITE